MNGGKNEIIDFLLATAIRKISLTPYPRELEELTFNRIKEIIRWNFRPTKRLVIPERINFLL